MGAMEGDVTAKRSQKAPIMEPHVEPMRKDGRRREGRDRCPGAWEWERRKGGGGAAGRGGIWTTTLGAASS